MRIGSAKLVKMISDDGLIEMRQRAKIGTVYEVDLDSLRKVGLFNFEHNMKHEKEIIDCTNGRWLPAELFEIEETSPLPEEVSKG